MCWILLSYHPRSVNYKWARQKAISYQSLPLWLLSAFWIVAELHAGYYPSGMTLRHTWK